MSHVDVEVYTVLLPIRHVKCALRDSTSHGTRLTQLISGELQKIGRIGPIRPIRLSWNAVSRDTTRSCVKSNPTMARVAP